MIDTVIVHNPVSMVGQMSDLYRFVRETGVFYFERQYFVYVGLQTKKTQFDCLHQGTPITVLLTDPMFSTVVLEKGLFFSISA